MNRNKLRKFVEQEGKPRVFDEEKLAKPLSKLLGHGEYAMPSLGRSRSSQWVIFYNMVEDYFRDFLGNEAKPEKELILNHRTGKLSKDYVSKSQDRKPLFLKIRENRRVSHHIFEGSPEEDSIYEENPSLYSSYSGGMSVFPAEFFTKKIKVKDHDDSEFMFVKYASNYSDSDTHITYFGGNSKPSLENNIHYSKIKYVELEGESFVYVENRTLSFIKKRYFMNLTANKGYYENMLYSLAYSGAEDTIGPKPLNFVFDIFDLDKFWFGHKEVYPVNSIDSYLRNPDLAKDIISVDEEDYLVFDDLDYTYSGSSDTSKSFIITAEGTYTAVRKKDGKLSLFSPKRTDCQLNNTENIVDSIAEAVRPALKNLGRKSNVAYWANSTERSYPISHLFTPLTMPEKMDPFTASSIRRSSIYPVLAKMYPTEEIDKSSALPKNSSKLPINPKEDEVQVLADYLAREHDNIYRDFKRNSYKVTLNKLREVFKYVPKVLVGTKADHKNGEAISLGGNMYIRLAKYLPSEEIFRSRRWGLSSGVEQTISKQSLIMVDKAKNIDTQIRATLGWILLTWSSLESEPNTKTFSVRRADIEVYVGRDKGVSYGGPYGPRFRQRGPLKINYKGKNGKYIAGPDEFEELEAGNKGASRKTLKSVLYDADMCEPLFEPTQYKLIAKDNAGNVAYAVVRPFLGIEYTADSKSPTITLAPSIPTHSLIFYTPKTSDPDGINAASVHLYRNDNGELVNCSEEADCILNDDGSISQRTSNSEPCTIFLRNRFIGTLRDVLTGSLSTEKNPKLNLLEARFVPETSAAWDNAFRFRPSKFFDAYKVPDIIFGSVGDKSKKLKSGASLKDYFKGTSLEILRVDAWLGLRPSDKTNLNLYNPNHWVNQRVLLDREFITYMYLVIVGGAYHLTSIVEAGLDTRELNFETYGDPGRAHPYHLRGPYGVAVLDEDLYAYMSSNNKHLSYYAGCFGVQRMAGRVHANNTRFQGFSSLVSLYEETSLKESTGLALTKIKNGETPTYADFILESFSPILEGKTKKERKALRTRLIKFFTSEDYMKSVLLTASQMMIEYILLNEGSKSDMLVPTLNFDEEIREVETQDYFGKIGVLKNFGEIFNMRICRELNYSASTIFKYLKSVVLEQRAVASIETALSLYGKYLDNLYKIREFGGSDFNSRKILFPESLRMQSDIASYNRDLIRDQEAMAKFQKGSQKYKIMEYKDSNYSIRMAKSPLELTLEGDTLNHCVGSYVRSMTNGENIIFFLRNRHKPDEPNVTVEFVPYTGSLSNVSVASEYTSVDIENGNLEFVMKGYINQVQGSSRRPVNLEEALFLSEWRDFVEDQMRKKIRIIPTFNNRKKVRIKHEFIFGRSILAQLNKHLKE